MAGQGAVPDGWQAVDDGEAWDRMLAGVSGHPLQSALWGDVRRTVEHMEDIRLAYFEEGRVQLMARVEIRQVPLRGKVAWIPRGPISVFSGYDRNRPDSELADFLRRKGFCVLVYAPYEVGDVAVDLDDTSQLKTVFIQLTDGLEVLENRLSSQWRSRVRKAKKMNVSIEQSSTCSDISLFHGMCEGLGRVKGFEVPDSELIFQKLVSPGMKSSIEFRLFVAKVDGVIAAGLLIARSGEHIHYMWGSSDRAYSKYRVSEAVQWGVIEWAVAEGCTLYDLEGIDPVNNPGGYQFKKKMGGEEVALRGVFYQPLNMKGRLILLARRLMGRI